MYTQFISQVIAGLFVLGLLLIPLYWFARQPATRRWLFVLAFGFINMGGLWFILVSFLITRLDGSTPPSLGEVIVQGLWIPILILALSNAALFIIRARKNRA